MPINLQIVPFGEFITERKEFFTIDDFTKYKRARVQSHGKGIVLRDEVYGSEVKTKKQQAARTGELLVAEIDAKVGGFGIVPSELDGAIVSSHYFLFQIDENKCTKGWLNWYIRFNSLEEQVNAQGSTNYAAIRANDVLNFKIPLPSVKEQFRIVAHVDALATKIQEANRLRSEANYETKVISLSSRNKVFEILEKSPKRKVSDISTVVRGSSPRPKGDIRFYGGNVPRLLIADISRDGKYVTPKIDSLTEEGAKLSRPMPKGSLVIAISGSYGVPAFLAVDACIHDGFIGFRDIDSTIDPEYFYQVLLLSRPYFDSVVKDSGLKNLTTDHLKNLDIPVPPLDEQRRIVAYLDGLQAKVNALRELQVKGGEELSALMPSILDKAFKGEL